MTRIVVIGDLVTDVVVRLAGPVEADSDTPARTSVRPGEAAGTCTCPGTRCWIPPRSRRR